MSEVVKVIDNVNNNERNTYECCRWCLPTVPLRHGVCCP